METVPNTFPALFIGYAVIWTVIILYVWSLGKRLKTVQQKFEERDTNP